MRKLKVVFVLLAVLLNFSCATGKKAPPTAQTAQPAQTTQTTQTAQPAQTIPPPPPFPAERQQDFRLTMAAVGDNLIHIELIKDAKTADGGAFNFDKYYTEVAPLLKEADIAFINQETLIAGEAFGYSGYPLFNGPKDIGRTLVNLGFDVVNHATNHAMDKGEKAVYEVIDFWDEQKGVLMLGLNRSEERRRDVAKNIIEKNNIKVGFLSYTYGTNGIPLPKDKPFLVSLIDTEVMAKEIDALRPLCDFLVVSMHWGSEYEHTPTARQQELARFLAARDVDLVIGHHPHVLQPLRALPREAAPPMVCFFSLGNFLSAQNEPPRLLGGMMRLTVKKEASPPHRVTIEEAELLPLVTHYEAGYRNFRVFPLGAYTEDIAALHLLRQRKMYTDTSYFHTLFKKISTTLEFAETTAER